MVIKILVATHKKYWMPDDDVYLPIHVGREGKVDLGYIGDNTGDNISAKNANYCELTALYWAWKNIKCDYIGLCHYRRYFAKNLFLFRLSKYLYLDNVEKIILSKMIYKKLLMKYDIILPKKWRLYKMNVYSQYKSEHNIDDLDECFKIICELYPEYFKACQIVCNRREIYICNMFVTKKSIFDEYMKWLFDILFALEKRIDISNYDSYQARVYGFLSERLFNVWLEKNKNNLNIKEMPVIFLENRQFITVIKEKIKNFLIL